MRLAVNFICFQLGWFSCVLGAANGMPWLGPLVVLAVVLIHLSLCRRPLIELWLVITAMLMGLFIDSLLLASGWLSYPGDAWIQHLAPYWIVAMWGLFATTLNVSMSWMKNRVLLAVAMGAIGGPLSYLGGAKLGAMSFNEPLAAILALGFAWALAMPVLMRIATRFNGVSESVPVSYVHNHWRAGNHA